MWKKFSFAELKGKIKVGQIVRYEGEECKILSVYDDRFESFECAFYYKAPFFLELYIPEKSFSKEDLSVGDVVIDVNGDKRKVLEVFENTFMLSAEYDFNKSYDWYTFQEAIDDGWTIQDAEPEEKEKFTKENVIKIFEEIYPNGDVRNFFKREIEKLN